jgi:hypothetical protein
LAALVIIGAGFWLGTRAGFTTIQPSAQITPTVQTTSTVQITTPQIATAPTLSSDPPPKGKNCESGKEEKLLPGLTPTPRAATAAPPQPGPTPTNDLTQLSQRAGFGMSTGAVPETWASQLRSGWYLSWATQLRSVSQLPEHWQMVRLRHNCYFPAKPYIQWLAARYPGLVWIIGNEPDVIWQDNITAEEYALVYHELYEAIKTADPSARVAVGAISQATPLRLEYLDRVLKAYQDSYAQPMPADWWTVHGFVLREERKSWGVEIPPGMTQDHGELREVSDHGQLDLFKGQVIAFRGWMAANGYREVPLALTEFGILMPEDYGFPTAFVIQYMLDSFAWLQTAADDTTGLSTDGNRLVQRWAWFSLADRLYPAPDLANLQTGKLTELGQAFRDYVLRKNP